MTIERGGKSHTLRKSRGKQSEREGWTDRDRGGGERGVDRDREVGVGRQTEKGVGRQTEKGVGRQRQREV